MRVAAQAADDEGEAGATPGLDPVDPFANMRKPVLPAYDWLAGKEVVVVTDAAGIAECGTWLGLVAKKKTGGGLVSLDTETAGPSHLWNDAVRLHDRVVKLKAQREALPHRKRRTPAENKLFDKLKIEQADAEDEAKDAGKRARQAGLCAGLLKCRLVQLYAGGSYVWVLDLFALAAAGVNVTVALTKLLGRKDITWVGHNIQFDVTVIYKTASVLPARDPHCTMLQSQALLSLAYLRKNLETRVNLVLGRPLDKSHQVSDWGAPNLTPAQIKYACTDAIATWDLYHGHLPMIDQRTSDEGEDCAGVYDLMRRAVRGTAAIQASGIEFDKVKHHKLALDLERKYSSFKARVSAELTKLYQPGGPEIDNIGSNAQWNKFLKACASPTCVQAWPKTKTGALSVSGDNLKVALGRGIVPPYLRSCIASMHNWTDVKTKRDRLGLTYQRWVVQCGVQRFRIYPSYMIGAAETGRYSASDPPLQQIPREDEFRELFIARPGYVLVVCDYGQIEVRVAAVLSGDKVLLKAIQDGVDIHALTALACFHDHPHVLAFLRTQKKWVGVEWIDLVKRPAVLAFFKKGKGKLLRQMAKPAIFGLVYGQGPGALALQIYIDSDVVVSRDEAERIQQTVLRLYPGLRKWMNLMRANAEESGLAWTPMRRCYDIGDSWYTKSVNTPCQGGAAEIMLEAMSYFPDALDTVDGGLVATVHDELIAEVKIEHAKQAEVQMIRCMTKAALDLFPTMPTHKLVEAGIGRTWKEAKENV